MQDEACQSASGFCHSFAGILLQGQTGGDTAVHPQQQIDRRRASKGLYRRPERRVKKRQPLHIQQETSTITGGQTGEGTAEYAVFEPQGLCGICKL